MIEFTLTFIFSQIFVFFAILSDILSFQYKQRKKVLFFIALSSLLIGIHYFLLGEINAGILLMFSFLSSVISIFTSNKKYLYIFFILYLIPITLNYSTPTDLLIFVGIYLGLISKFQSKDEHLRIIMMIASLFVISFDIIIFSPLAIILDSIFLISNIVGYYRFYIKK